MFQGLINQAKSSAASFIGTYLARASVAVPFVVAAGFATAAASLALTQRFGATNAFWIMAAGFCVLGMIAAAIVARREQETALAEQQQSEESTLGEISEMASVASAAATQAAGHLPTAVLMSALSTPTASVQALGRLVARHLPLLVLLAVITLLFWPTEEAPERTSDEAEPPSPETAEQQAEATDEPASMREAA